MNEPGIEWCKQHVNCLAIRSFKNHWPEFVEYLQKIYPGLKFSEQLYRHYYHGPIPCPVCGRLPKYQNFTSGYSTYCSIKCATNAESTKSKFKQTCQERYGSDSPLQSQEIQAKIKKTIIARHGGMGLASSSIKEKAKLTCQERYGTDNPAKADEVKEKAKRTCLERYGTKYVTQSKEAKAKSKQTRLERYGSEHYNNPEKAKQTCLERYGVENPSQSKKIQEKIVQVMLERYGVPYGLLNTIPGYSKSSQEYFKSLDEQYPNAMYATKGGEYKVGPYLLDWYDPDSNTVIEFNGDYWHANPKLYSEDWIHPIKKCTAKELWEHDREKKEYLEALGYKVKVVWESEINT